MLTLNVGSTHEDFALHIHQSADRSCSHTMLTGTSLGNDTGLAHFLCHQNLTDGIIDLMSTCMVQVFTLQIELASVLLTHALGIIER